MHVRRQTEEKDKWSSNRRFNIRIQTSIHPNATGQTQKNSHTWT